jgi:hypothetical protein
MKRTRVDGPCLVPEVCPGLTIPNDDSAIIPYYVTIDYRTKGRLATWSGVVPATSMDDAGKLAERQLRQRRRRAAFLRIDRVAIR